MIRHRPWLTTALAVLGLAWEPCGADQSQVGRIGNPSLEIMDTNGSPTNWTAEPAPRGGGTVNGAGVASDVAHDGKYSLTLSAFGVTWQSKTLLRPYASYRLTGWIRTENVAAENDRGATFELRGVQVTAPVPKITGTREWTRLEIPFDTGGQDSMILVATMGGGRGARGSRGADRSAAQGQAWFDDLNLELVSARNLDPSVTIEAAKTRQAMPDLIYGQFIEHLGRCIYGGIWAEMIEDRKFYSAVDETRRDKVYVPSPWKAVGGSGAVTMAGEKPFVGEHTPEIHLDGTGTAKGINQSGLGVVAGKGYLGYVVLAGDSSAAPIEVSLSWGSGARERQTVRIGRITHAYEKYPIRFRPSASSDSAALEIVGRGKGSFRVGTSSLMPEDNVKGMRRDTMALLKELNAPIYRWPGGNFVSGYNWKDGIGDRDRRPPRKNPAWTGIEHNDFGIHEFFDFLEELNAQPFIALNTGLGSVESAIQQVEYVNGGPNTPMGKLRAANGHPGAFHCTYWAVGNEMSGSWQLGNVPIEEYVQRHNAFSQAVLAVDRSIKLVASGEAVRASSDWDRQLLSNCADHLNLNSKHFYKQDWHGGGLMTHVRQIGDAIRAIADAHREYLRTIPQMQGKDIRVSLDEWNYWYGPHVFGELGTRYFLRDALGIAAGINEYSRQTDVIALACYAQTVNVIGAIKTSKTAAVLDSTGEALVMYRRHFGTVPVEVTGSPEPLDVAAAWTKDRKSLTVSVINPTHATWRLRFKLAGARPTFRSRSWTLAGPDEMAYNEPGRNPTVRFTERSLTGVTDVLELAPVTATIFDLEIEPGRR